jgi:type II secretory pathway component PulJ
VVKRAGGRNGEAGFTLVEVMVASTMMFALLSALYAIFGVNVRAFGYGGDRIQDVGDARLALNRMEREIRAAYTYDLTSSPPKRYLFSTRWTRPGRPCRPRRESPSATRRTETAR